MTPTPKIKVERIGQLEPGELFLFEHDGVRCVGFLCSGDRNRNQTKLVLPLGPRLPRKANGPQFLDAKAVSNTTAVSFGKDFVVRLPAQLNGWSETPPTDEYPCLMVNNLDIYFRAKQPTTGSDFASCYINIGTGMVEVQSEQPPDVYAVLAGMYATSWEFLTKEPEPQSILEYPF
jgi:hypothetical protein